MSIINELVFPNYIDQNEIDNRPNEAIMKIASNIIAELDNELAKKLGVRLANGEYPLLLIGIKNHANIMLNIQEMILAANVVLDFKILTLISNANSKLVSFFMAMNTEYIGVVEITKDILEDHRRRSRKIDEIIKKHWEWQDTMSNRFVKSVMEASPKDFAGAEGLITLNTSDSN